MKKRFLLPVFAVASLLTLTACPGDDNGNGTNVAGSPSSTFTAIFQMALNGEPVNVLDGDAGAVSLTTEPRSVL